MSKHWVKVPRPGEFRGAGDWVEFEKSVYGHPAKDCWSNWDFLRNTGYLPTHFGETPPEDA